MTKQEYDKKIKVITANYELLKKDLYRKFATANNTYKVGDIVTDHIGSIIIEKIEFLAPSTFFNRDYPECSYLGIELTKKGEPKKNGSKRYVYQYNIK